MEFEKFNNNPLKLINSDCVIRAISEGLNKSWFSVYDDLYKIGRVKCLVLNDKDCYREYLSEVKGLKMVVPKVKKGKKRLKVKDLDKGTYILSVANHLTIIKNGVLKDIWDCSDNCVYRYWIIEEDYK